MTALQKIALGTAPAGTDGDTFRTASTRMNANVDVLDTQTALSSTTTITSPSALTIANVGRRTSISLTATGTINLPAANTCAADQVLFLRNIGAYVVNLAPSAGSGDSVTSTTLNPNETVMFETNGSNLWRPLWRSKNSINEVVNGTLTVGGGVAGNLPISGKVSAINAPNLLLNGSGEFGTLGWSSSLSFAQGSFDAGTFLQVAANATAATSSINSAMFPVVGGEPYAISGEIYIDAGATGAFYFDIQYYDASGALVLDGNNISRGLDSAGTWKAVAGADVSPVSPATAVTARARLVWGNATWTTLAFRRVKVEPGAVSSLYSMEASIAYLLGSPAFKARPTFAGSTPWDSGNLPGSSTNGVFNFTSRPTFAGNVPWDNNNLPAYAFVNTDRKNLIAVRWDSSVGGFRVTVDSTGYVGSFVNTNSNNSIKLGWTGSVVNLTVDTVTLGAITTSSDYRAKTNVKTLASGASEIVKALRPVSYEWRDFGPFKADGKEHAGFIAHELQAVIPSAVHGDKDAVDDKGHPQMQSLVWSPIVAVLTGSLQEALARIDELEAMLK